MGILLRLTDRLTVHRALLGMQPNHHRTLYAHLFTGRSGYLPHYRRKPALAVDVLHAQIRWLRDLGFTPASPGNRLSQRTFSVSTDDGYRENHSVIAPYLLGEGIPLTLFLCDTALDNRAFLWKDRLEYLSATIEPQRLERAVRDLVAEYGISATGRTLIPSARRWPMRRIDELSRILWKSLGLPSEAFVLEELRPYLTHDEVRELQGRGVNIGSHTRTHRDLSRMEEQDVLAEVKGSFDALRALFGDAVRDFSYPYGHRVRPAMERKMIRHAGIGRVFGTGYDLRAFMPGIARNRDLLEQDPVSARFAFSLLPLIRGLGAGLR